MLPPISATVRSRQRHRRTTHQRSHRSIRTHHLTRYQHHARTAGPLPTTTWTSLPAIPQGYQIPCQSPRRRNRDGTRTASGHDRPRQGHPRAGTVTYRYIPTNQQGTPGGLRVPDSAACSRSYPRANSIRGAIPRHKVIHSSQRSTHP